MKIRYLAIASAAALTAGCGGSPGALNQAPGSFAPFAAHRSTSGYQEFFKFDHKDGFGPWGSLIVHDGKLYGTAEGGQTTTCGSERGCGVIFSLTPGGSEKVLYAFDGRAGGAYPHSPLTYFNGALYGTTQNGGTNCRSHCGMIYSFSIAKSTLTTIWRFDGTDGKYPTSSLVLMNGKFYGTTLEGGHGHCEEGCGVVYSISPSGAFTDLYNFPGGTGGESPDSLVELGGTLYGILNTAANKACSYGCGGIFRITPSGDEHMIYEFKGGSDGNGPTALIVNGDGFYGATESGGANGNGTVFTLTTAGTKTIIYDFPNAEQNGNSPNALTLLGNALYGTTAGGGSNGDGTLFTLTTSGTENVLHSFTGEPDGRNPSGALTALDGVYYGATNLGGLSGNRGFGDGTIYTFSP